MNAKRAGEALLVVVAARRWKRFRKAATVLQGIPVLGIVHFYSWLLGGVRSGSMGDEIKGLGMRSGDGGGGKKRGEGGMLAGRAVQPTSLPVDVAGKLFSNDKTHFMKLCLGRHSGIYIIV